MRWAAWAGAWALRQHAAGSPCRVRPAAERAQRACWAPPAAGARGSSPLCSIKDDLLPAFPFQQPPNGALPQLSLLNLTGMLLVGMQSAMWRQHKGCQHGLWLQPDL